MHGIASWVAMSALRGMKARLWPVGVVVLAVLSAGILAPAPQALAATFVPISGAGSTWSFNAINDWITNVADLCA
jgi:hypothetical protein